MPFCLATDSLCNLGMSLNQSRLPHKAYLYPLIAPVTALGGLGPGRTLEAAAAAAAAAGREGWLGPGPACCGTGCRGEQRPPGPGCREAGGEAAADVWWGRAASVRSLQALPGPHPAELPSRSAGESSGQASGTADSGAGRKGFPEGTVALALNVTFSQKLQLHRGMSKAIPWFPCCPCLRAKLKPTSGGDSQPCLKQWRPEHGECWN
ncbi:spidroin-2-like [Pezoporus occidentalis]|uniref:spidroin-2-like n=1 Tax=Pezoporus occidentalis TaxID=407982 RepID=UPI002F907D66